MLTLATLALLAATSLPVEALSYHSNNPRNHIHHHHAQLERQKRTVEQNMGKKMARKMKRADAGAYLLSPLSLSVYTTTDARGQKVFVCSGCCGRGSSRVCAANSRRRSLSVAWERGTARSTEEETRPHACRQRGRRRAEEIEVRRRSCPSSRSARRRFFFPPSLLAGDEGRVQTVDDGDDGDVGRM